MPSLNRVVVFKDGQEEPVTKLEVTTLHRCGLLARIAVNERWHTDHDADVRNVLTSVRANALQAR